ncbi:MAG: LysM peptidoglycan-binding domain-containing protein, partial [Gemmatimonadetes bacterium]|nr:LysM peptidoglycan-binding domain-containing protein [Gemmatimonadota bacterium]
MGAPQQRPQVHIVQQGETLWALAELYYGDPLLWPEIYRLNTLVVEDPHWIYPGEELVLGPVTPAEALPEMPMEQPPVGPPVAEPPALPPGDTSQAAMQRVTPVEAPPVETPVVEAPPPPPPPPADASGPTIFSRRGPGAGMTRVEALGGEVYRDRPVRRGEFYAAGFLTENASFPWARVLGDARDPPMERKIQTSSAMIYSRRVPGWGDVVVPSGVVRVRHVSGRDVLADVVMQFHRVVDGQVAIPLEPFRDPGLTTPVPVENGLTASVIEMRDIHPVPNQQNIVFIDAGRAQGVVLGDLFVVLEPPDAAQAQVQEATALLQIVHVRDRSASGFILQVYQPGIQPSQPVRL